MPLNLLSLVMVLLWGFGTFVSAANREGQPPISRTEGRLLPFAVEGEASMRVLWRISEFKVGESAVWGQEEARTLLFMPLDIDATTIMFNGKICRDVIFEKTMVNAEEYLHRAHHTTPRAIGIEQAVVEMVKTNCNLPGFGEYMRLKDRSLIIHLNGVFFYFQPAVNY